MIDTEQFPLLREWYGRFRKACPDDPGFVREFENERDEALHYDRLLRWCQKHMTPETSAALARETLRKFLWDSE